MLKNKIKIKNKDLEVKLAQGMGHFGHLTEMTHLLVNLTLAQLPDQSPI